MTTPGFRFLLILIYLVLLTTCKRFTESNIPDDLKGLWFNAMTLQWSFKLDKGILKNPI